MEQSNYQQLTRTLEWAMPSLKRLDHHHEQDIFETDIRVDLTLRHTVLTCATLQTSFCFMQLT